MPTVKLSQAEIDPDTVKDIHPWPGGSIVITSVGNYVLDETPEEAAAALGLPYRAPGAPPPADVPATPPPTAKKKPAPKKPEPPARHR